MGMSYSSNWILEYADRLVTPPDHKDLKLKNPDSYIILLNDISSPKERLKNLFISTINIRDEPSYEAMWIRNFSFGGFAAGFFAGAFFNSPDIHQDYVRKHNASVFDNKYVGNRHFWDTLAYNCAGRGFRWGIRSCAVTTAVAAIGISSITYRNKLYLPDWLIGYTTFGALTRLWLGPRAMAAGGIIWLAIGSFGYGLFSVIETASGISMSEMEYMSHTKWLRSRQNQLNKNHLHTEESIRSYAQETFGDVYGK